MQLKQYQLDTLATLRRFLENSRVAGPEDAFNAIVDDAEQKKRLGSYHGKYRPLGNLGTVPYCCLRLPTGGGKTILGAHAIKVAQEAWIEKEYPVVLWLVPSDIIRTQTVDALKKPNHPYRMALDDGFDGRVRIFDIEDFASIRPSDMRDSLCLVVGTYQTLQVSDTNKRKVYAHHEALEPHFAGIPATMEGLEINDAGKTGAGTIKYSFANLMHLHRPLLIVDEAHKALTPLGQTMRERLNPCAVIEFSATPDGNKNNTLHNVKASELKDAEMIKLPIVLGEHQTWQQAVDAAIQDRATLEEEAKGESQYVRPLVLFQAEDKGREVTVDVLKQYLLDASITADKIAIATGDQRDLDSIDLFSRQEPVRFIITKEALKEGWDCSFAYVFCSVANVSSATDVEQLLGRVMRMPYAAKRKSDKLNRAYAHVPETRFGAAAVALRDKLVSKMGFEQQEAENILVPSPQGSFEGEGFFGQQSRPRPKLDVTLRPNAVLLENAAKLLDEGVRVSQAASGEVKIVAEAPLSKVAHELIVTAIVPEDAAGFAESVKTFELECERELSPAERGMRFKVPALAAWVQGELIAVETDTLLDDFEWSISSTPARLEANEFDVQDVGNTFEIFLDGERMVMGQADTQVQLPWDAPVVEWTAERLAIWLDKQNHDPAFSQSDMLKWTTELVRYLIENRKFTASQLYRMKFILSRKVAEKITVARKLAQEESHQKLLFAPYARVEVALSFGQEFRKDMYFGQPTYRGPWRFMRNFLGPHGVGAFDGQRNAFGEGEEFDCAIALDRLPQVKHWVRNIVKHPNSFRLPMAHNNFYPDFVAELVDGRMFVVEYKGGLTIHEATERRSIGEKWEQASAGRGVFMIVEKLANGLDMFAQMKAKLGT